MKQLITLASALFASCLLALTTFAGPESLPTSDKEMKEVAPVQPSCDFSWTGFYVGAKVGYGWSDNSELNDVFLISPTQGIGVVAPDHHDLDPDGVIGGGEVGFNWQWHRFVFGAAADFFGSDMSDDFRVDASAFGTPDRVLSGSSDIDWFGTVRARIGFAPTCRLLIYGTGGFAYAHVDESALLDARPFGGTPFYPASGSDIDTGWTAGGGLEYAISRHWTVKVEYLYIDVGDNSRMVPGIDDADYSAHYHFENQFHTVTGGINFKF